MARVITAILSWGTLALSGHEKSERLLDPASQLILADETLFMPAFQGIQMEQVCQEPRPVG